MSSFIVNDKVINSVVTYLYSPQNHASPYNARGKLEAVGFSHPEHLGEDMYRLNLAAVENRYGEYAAGTLGAFSGSDYTYQPVDASPVQVLKDLHCWRYQCAEGECPSTILYKLLNEYAGSLAQSIVRTLPEYATATWG